MTQSLGTSLVSLRKILQSNRFVIPDYQRGYAWEKEHVEAMLEDIKHMLDYPPEHEHFTGTLVLSSHREGSGVYEVVDGQQRLTTLMIVLAGMVRPEISRHLLW